MNKMDYICPTKLNEAFDTLFELQQRLKISDEYLHQTARNPVEDRNYKESLITLLEASLKTRDNLITWYLKQTSMELNATISLLTAKIKFIEYKLDKCDGLDLHQACSLSLVNFCNILSDLTVHNVAPSKRKTMRKISSDANIPVWLSHYRNQICHVPSESPCIAILVPLVIRSLDYMKESFWVKIIDRNKFDFEKCDKLIRIIFDSTIVESVNQSVILKRDISQSLGKKRLKQATASLKSCGQAIKSIRRLYLKNNNQVTDVIFNYLLSHNPSDKSKNCGLLLEQIILARCLEKFIFKLLALLEMNPDDQIAWEWLDGLIRIISKRKKENIKKSLKNIGLNISVKMMRLTEISPVKCCHIAYKLSQFRHPLVRKMIYRLRSRLSLVLGKERTILFLKLTDIAKHPDIIGVNDMLSY